MPIPKPKDGESQKEFISRCMGDKTMNKEYPDQKQRAGVCYDSWRKPKKEGKLLPGVMIGIKRTIEQEETVSKKPWGKIKKSKLPASCFLWVEDEKKKNTWHLPYKEGAGGIDQKTGMYRKAGKINVNAVRAIIQALGGARTGKAMKVPANVRNKAESLAKRLNIGKFGKNEEAILIFDNFKELRRLREIGKGVKRKNMKPEAKPKNRLYDGRLIVEAFQSLEQALSKAIKAEGKDVYVVDFSQNEVVYAKYENGQSTYYKRPYKIEKGEAVLQGSPEVVDRKVTYEGERFGAKALVELADKEREVKING
jgi:hypothetical protein